MADRNLPETIHATMLQAVYELDKLARVLPSLVPVDEDQHHYAVKGVAGRMLRLTSVLLSGLDDDQVHASDIQGIVNFTATGQG